MIVFVAGLSRSGKTSRSQYAATTLPNIEYLSVSQLLRSAGRKLPVRTIAEAIENQRYALEALTATPLQRTHRLVDGHALIETVEGPMLVPDWFFDDLAPDIILLVYDRPEAIISRRLDISSEHRMLDVAALAKIEKAACERTASRLGIPLVELDAPSLEGFSDIVRHRLSRN